MCKKNEKIDKIDFLLQEDRNKKLIFRFLPQQSSCHSFNDEPPKSKEDIYKVYFAYQVLGYWRWEEDEDWEKTTVLFDQPCDECSIIDEVAFVCSQLAEGKEVYVREDGEKFQLLNKTMMPMGMGTDWTILKRLIPVWNEDEDWDLEGEEEEIFEPLYTFMLFDYSGVGFRFQLKEDKIKAFGEYLNECCDYMLAHGDPI